MKKKVLCVILAAIVSLSCLSGCGFVKQEDYNKVSSENSVLKSKNDALSKEKSKAESENSALKSLSYKIGTVGDTAFQYPSSWTSTNDSDTIIYHCSSNCVVTLKTVDLTNYPKDDSSLATYSEALLGGLKKTGTTISTQDNVSVGDGVKAIKATGAMSNSIAYQEYMFIQGNYFISMSFGQQASTIDKNFSDQIKALLKSITEIKK